MDLNQQHHTLPRYTSYPTVPNWNMEQFNEQSFYDTLKVSYWESCKEVSLYIHLPFCESLCTYCACNTHITKNHEVEEKYISYLHKEWKMYLDLLPDAPVIKEIHLGGGTPTFFSPENLQRLLSPIINSSCSSSETHFSFEGHPLNTTYEHLQTLYNLGFDRVSLGIQDFDKKVQQLINRKQSYEQIKYVTKAAREIGYKSVNYDMIYGLPGQTMNSMISTFNKVNTLRPDRIAYYAYSHVPSIKPAQRHFEDQLPSPVEKWQFAVFGKKFLTSIGYQEVGMDHYCLPNDELIQSSQNGDLHRNFMGYTTQNSKLQIGIGASAIGDTWSSFIQNEKKVKSYYEKLDHNVLPICKGHIHTTEELFTRKHILNLMCHFKTSWLKEELLTYGLSFDHDKLLELQENGFLNYHENGIEVTESGKKIIRVICSALDKGYQESEKRLIEER